MSPLSLSSLYALDLAMGQNAGDLWYFPAGIPHSLQATATDPNGAEFLLVRQSASYGMCYFYTTVDLQ